MATLNTPLVAGAPYVPLGVEASFDVSDAVTYLMVLADVEPGSCLGAPGSSGSAEGELDAESEVESDNANGNELVVVPGVVEIRFVIDGDLERSPAIFTLSIACPGMAASGSSLVHLMPWQAPTERPGAWPRDVSWDGPGPVPVGHLAPGRHTMSLWARALGADGRVLRAGIVVSPVL